MASERAAYLVEQLQDASNALIGLSERIPADLWLAVTTPGEWSPGKDAEHVADGNALHQWDVCSTLGHPAGKEACSMGPSASRRGRSTVSSSASTSFPVLASTGFALRPDAIQTLYASKLGAGLAPNTVRKIHSVLHRALKMAVKWGYLPKNPADDTDRPAAPKRDLRLPTPTELATLIDSAAESEDQLAPLWTLAIHTGLRRVETVLLELD